MVMEEFKKLMHKLDKTTKMKYRLILRDVGVSTTVIGILWYLEVNGIIVNNSLWPIVLVVLGILFMIKAHMIEV